jgi:inorganic pyrophosphatase
VNKFDNEFWDILDRLINENDVFIDRPKGSCHPKHTNITYPLDYGYIKNTVSSDGAGIDVWVGSSGTKKACAIISSVDLWKRDSEIIVLVSCTREEIGLVYMHHNNTAGMKGILNIRSLYGDAI